MKRAFTKKICIIILVAFFSSIAAHAHAGLKKHVFKVHHQHGSNANLSYLHLSHGDLSPAFAQTTLTYTADVPNSVKSITLREYTADASATVKVNGITIPLGSITGSIPLNVGTNTVHIVVTAQDGITTQTYTVTVTRAPSSNANLSYLHLSHGDISPAFAQTTTSYTATVANDIGVITLKFGIADTTSKATVNGSPLGTQVVSAPLTLAVGPNTINVVVTAQDNLTIQTYTVIVRRLPSSNANLGYLVINRGTLSPVFNQTVTSYTASVPNYIDTINVKFGTADPTSTVTVNSSPLVSGVISAPIPLVVGSNTIHIAVTAQDGVTTKTYTVIVTRGGSPIAYLRTIELAYGVSLEPVFTAKTFNYHAFGHEFSAVKIITGEPNETVTINGTAITSGVFSDPIPLKLGDNIITIKVTAQDGITTQTYTITVTRQLTAPRIAYNAKNTYVTGTAIVPLIPTNAGDSVAAPAFGKPVFYLGAVKPVSLTRSLIKSGVRPMFFGDAGNGTVYQLMGSVAVSSDFNAPYGLATDTEGALYVADAGKSSITKFSVTGFNFSYVYGPPVALGSGFNAPTGIAVDPSSGFIYVADNGNGLLKKMSPDGTTITTIGTGLVKPAGVALDAYGNLYVTDNGDNTVKKIAAGSNTATVFASGFRNPFGISIDGGGNIYVADKGLGTIVRVSASGSSKVTIGSGFSGPTSVFAENIGFDAGVLYVTDTNRGRIDKITPVGGYYILPALPAGLHFNAVTGVISGTPTAVSSLTNYVVYAYNGSGVSWTTFRIVVNAPPGGLATQETSDGILVHQALSPNGDGLNDVLKIDGLNAFPDNKLTIMNKDGAVIFAAKNYGSNLAAFDGHSNKGKLQKPGDYFYLLEYKAGTQVKRKTGYILLKY